MHDLNPAYYVTLAEQLSRTPAIDAVAFSRSFPAAFDAPIPARPEKVRAVPAPADDAGAEAYFEAVSPGFFELYEIPIREGRDFTWRDNAQSRSVAIINDALRRRLFGDDPAVGRRVVGGGGADAPELEIVGVVADSAIANLRDPHGPVVFRPWLQGGAAMRSPRINVLARVPTSDAVTALRGAVQALGAEYVPFAYTLDAQVSRVLVRERVASTVSLAFAALAALLACLGTYGQSAYGVSRRRRELAVRMALGASRGSVIRQALRQVTAVAVIGVIIGAPAALFAARAVRSLLFGIAADDVPTLVASSIAFLCLTIAAGFVPAHRAAVADPAPLLREQ